MRNISSKSARISTGMYSVKSFSQPDPTKSEDILKGICAIRELNIKSIEASGLAAADEMLYPELFAAVRMV